MHPSDRQTVLARQKTLVRTLVNSAPPDPAFDVERLQLAGRMLRAKRYRAARRAFPELFRRLGEQSAREFHRYASAVPLRGGGAVEDAIAFARHACRMSALPLSWRFRLLAVRTATYCRRKVVSFGKEGA
jgi:hypothetical protein